jgi:glycosyltransferase involved in cell wall biosynthesis
MRLLHVVATGQRRGAEVFAADLVRALEGDGIDQRVAVLRGSGLAVDFPSPVAVLRNVGWRVPGVRLDLGTLGALRDLIDDWRPDVVQVHGGEPLKHAVLAARRSGAPVVYRRIGSAPARISRGPGRFGHGQLMRRATRVVAVAEALRRETIETFRVPPGRVLTIPNAVDAERLQHGRPRQDVRAMLEIPFDAGVLISVGALTWEKDPEAHLEVSDLVRKKLPDMIHLFVGDGPLRPELERAIHERALGGRVRLLGARNDVPELLSGADVMLLASRVEGLPGCLIEAGLVRRPAAAFALAGVPEVVQDGRTGFLAPPGDVQALARAASRLLADPDLRASMGEAAEERYRTLFDIRVVAPRYLGLYRELAA